MIIEAYPAVDELIIPESVDYVGCDKYFVKDPLNDRGYVDLLENIINKSYDHQQIFIIMDTHFISHHHKDYGNIELDMMGDVANSYYELAKSNDKIIGIIGYVWPSGFDDNSSIGARNMPQEVIDIYKQIGLKIINNNNES